MGSKKNISVNLRDLQRVMNKEEDELPNITSENKPKLGASKNFEYKLSSNRWENEDCDDDFDIPGLEKNPLPEPDFTTLRRPLNRTNERKSSSSPSASDEPSSVDYNWRSTEFPKVEDTEESWRTLRSRDDKSLSTDKNCYFVNRPIRESDLTREPKSEEPRKLYVPRFRREASPSFTNDRFSCLDPREESNTRGYGFRDLDSLRDEGDFRESKSPLREEKTRNDSGFDEKYNEERPIKTTLETQSSLTEEKPKEQPKKGLFIPSYRRNIKREDTVEDIFLKASRINTVSESERSKKEESERSKKELQDNQVLISKRNEIIKHNKMFTCSKETSEVVEEYVTSLLNSNEENDFPDIDEKDSLVPSILTCVVVAKNCESCKTLEEVRLKFKRVKKWLLYTTKSQDTRKLLTELSKVTNHWGYPSLSDSLYLVEALFDSLHSLGIITKNDFLKWFEDDVDEIPNRVTLLIQLMNWKKWLTGEELEEPESEEYESDSDSEEDSDDLDIEANVPKPIRLPKGVKFK